MSEKHPPFFFFFFFDARQLETRLHSQQGPQSRHEVRTRGAGEVVFNTTSSAVKQDGDKALCLQPCRFVGPVQPGANPSCSPGFLT